MGGGAEFGGGAVVHFDVVRGALEEDADAGAGVGGDAEAFCDLGVACGGSAGGANGDGDFGDGIALVRDFNGNEIASELGFAIAFGAGGDMGDGEVRQAAVAVDPVAEEPREFPARSAFE